MGTVFISDVYRRQILTYKNRPRAERVIVWAYVDGGPTLDQHCVNVYVCWVSNTCHLALRYITC